MTTMACPCSRRLQVSPKSSCWWGAFLQRTFTSDDPVGRKRFVCRRCDTTWILLVYFSSPGQPWSTAWSSVRAVGKFRTQLMLSESILER